MLFLIGSICVKIPRNIAHFQTGGFVKNTFSFTQILICFVFAIILFISGQNQNRNIYALRDHGIPAQAEIVVGTATYRVIVSYDAVYKSQSGKEIRAKLISSEGVQLGQVQSILYSPYNPYIAMLENTPMNIGLYTMSVIFGLFGLLGAYVRISMYVDSRKNQEG